MTILAVRYNQYEISDIFFRTSFLRKEHMIHHILRISKVAMAMKILCCSQKLGKMANDITEIQSRLQKQHCICWRERTWKGFSIDQKVWKIRLCYHILIHRHYIFQLVGFFWWCLHPFLNNIYRGRIRKFYMRICCCTAHNQWDSTSQKYVKRGQAGECNAGNT